MTLLHCDVGIGAQRASRSSAGAGRWPRWRCCTSPRRAGAGRFARLPASGGARNQCGRRAGRGGDSAVRRGRGLPVVRRGGRDAVRGSVRRRAAGGRRDRGEPDRAGPAAVVRRDRARPGERTTPVTCGAGHRDGHRRAHRPARRRCGRRGDRTGRRGGHAVREHRDRRGSLPRLGFGAVLGRRGIKAVVCVPGEPPTPHDPAAAVALADAYRRDARTPGRLAVRPPGFGAWPGSGVDAGYMSVRNFADSGPSSWPGLHPDRFADHLTFDGAGGCPGCPNDCLKSYAGAGCTRRRSRCSPNLGIDDLAVVLAANARCQALGLDPVSLGGTLGCLFEAVEHGRVPAEPRGHPAGRGRLRGDGRPARPGGARRPAGSPDRRGAQRLAARLGHPR